MTKRSVFIWVVPLMSVAIAIVPAEAQGVDDRHIGGVRCPVSHVETSIPQVGTEGDDVLIGTNGDDVIDGRGGNDIICGGGGDDVLIGGPGIDLIFGDGGNDRIDGGDGDDIVVGGSGKDVLAGGAGNDVLIGDRGNDEMQGGDGNDLLSGRAGRDRLRGGEGDDVLIGGASVVLCDGGPGRDLARGCKKRAKMQVERKLRSPGKIVSFKRNRDLSFTVMVRGARSKNPNRFGIWTASGPYEPHALTFWPVDATKSGSGRKVRYEYPLHRFNFGSPRIGTVDKALMCVNAFEFGGGRLWPDGLSKQAGLVANTTQACLNRDAQRVRAPYLGIGREYYVQLHELLTGEPASLFKPRPPRP